MKGDDAALALVILLLAMKNQEPEWGGPWQWPIPDIITPDGVRHRGEISQEFRRTSPPHYGVDLMYRDWYQPGNKWTAPKGTPVLAARAGTLWSVERTARGWSVVLDHGRPWATYYQHLEVLEPELAAGNQGIKRSAPAMRIAMGQRLGLMGQDPTDGGHVRHLHFAAWYQGAGDPAAVDPSTAMASWARSTVRLPGVVS